MARVVATRYVQVGNQRLPLKRVRGVLQMLPRVVATATAVQVRVSAEETRELLIDKLMAGSPAAPAAATATRPRRISRSKAPTTERAPFKLAPLSPKYVQEKARKGEDGRTLIATGDYVNGIIVKKVALPGVGIAWGVGLDARDHEPSGLPLVVLATILERGSAAVGLPPRPHWRPTRRIVLRQLRKAADNVKADVLRRLLREAR